MEKSYVFNANSTILEDLDCILITSHRRRNWFVGTRVYFNEGCNYRGTDVHCGALLVMGGSVIVFFSQDEFAEYS